jgi:CMP-N,N'-diacetyllegionaminic acid synthase
MSDILCTICARGGSKGVKNKNIRLLNGKPLIAHTIEQALASNLFDNVVISTDSDQISEVAKKYGGEVFFKRDEVLSSDTAGKLDVIKDAFIKSEAHYGKKYKYHIDLDATSPLRDVADITESFKQFLKDKNENLITGMHSRRSPYFNLVELGESGSIGLSKTLESPVVRRQDVPQTFDMNASIYIWTRDALLNQTTLFDQSTGLYVMPEERSIDIDSELDFEFVEFLMEKQKC